MKFGDSIITILTAIVGLAVIAVLVGKNAQTGSVLTAGGNAFSSVIKAAVAPVSGSGILGS
jgi:PRD1 phage membrane DNA delivery